MVAGIWKPDLGSLAGQITPGVPTTFGEVYEATRQETLTGHALMARQWALEQAIDEKNDRIKSLTGVVLDNPTRASMRMTPDQTVDPASEAETWTAYRQRLSDLRTQYPQHASVLVDFDENELARAQARANDKRSKEVSALGPGGGATLLAQLAGGFVGSMQDPPQALVNILAPGAGTGRSLLYHGLKSAAINAGAEAAMQPFIQSWRKEAGLESGVLEALKDIAMAGAAGGALDVVFRGGLRTVRVMRGGKWIDEPVSPQVAGEALDDAAKRLPEGDPIRDLAEGRPERLVAEVEKMRDAAPPELRAAAHTAETEVLFGASAGADEAAHLEGLAQAIRRAAAPDVEPPGFSGQRSPELQRLVEGGAVPEDLARLVARSAPVERHADLAEKLLERRPDTPDAARAIIADELAKPRPSDAAEVSGLALSDINVRALADVRAALLDKIENGSPDAERAQRLLDTMPTDAAAVNDGRLALWRDFVTSIEGSFARNAGSRIEAQHVSLKSLRAAGLADADGFPVPRSSPELKASLRSFDETRLGARGFDEPHGEGARLQTEALVRDVQSRVDAMRGVREAVAQAGAKAAPDAGDVQQRPSVPRAYSPEFLAREAEAVDELLKVAARLPKAVRVQVEQNIRIGRYELDGYWDRRNNVLAVALQHNADKAAGTMRHEEIHALRHFGLFTDREWGLLTERARKLGFRQDIGAEMLQQYRQTYAGVVAKDLLRQRGMHEAADLPWDQIKRALKLEDGAEIGGLERLGLWDEGRLQALLDEEAVAELASRRRAGDSFGLRLEQVLDRIGQFLEAVGNAMRGLGFDTADAVFRRIETGDVGARFREMKDVTLPGGAKVRGIDVMAAIRAYHGSPHDFDRFDISKIGTGEGAQAYGPGLYFAESMGVAKSYRDALGGKKLKDGTPFDELNPAHWAADAVNRAGGDRAKAAQLISAEMTPDMKLYDGGQYQRLLRAKGMLERNEAVPVIGSGKLYEVNIKAEPEDFLDWDKPLNQQSEKVQGAATALADQIAAKKRERLLSVGRDADFIQSDVDFITSPDRTFGELFPILRGLGLRDDASKLLNDAGVPGVRYLDQGSRKVGDGTRNYVVFDDKLIEIVAKDGQPIERELARASLDADGARVVDACKLGAG